MRVDKAWGHELWVVNLEGPNYCGKKLFVREGRRCSWHRHRLKHETFLVQRGAFRVRHLAPEAHAQMLADGLTELEAYRAAGVRVLSEGDVFVVPPGTLHQFEALVTDGEIVEFSTFHRDEDVERPLGQGAT